MLLILLACTPIAPDVLPTWGYEQRAPQTCQLPERPVSTASVAVQPAYPNLRFKSPVWMFQSPDDPTHWYVLERQGKVYRFVDDPETSTSELVADITDRVEDGYSELGLLGAAFDPDWPNTPYLYLSYTGGDVSHPVSHISRFPVSNGMVQVDQEKILLTINQPYANHNGGNILFGPDGYLYAGYGDGGSSGDPAKNGQNTDVLLGKMLRMDVKGGDPYAIPADNPFAEGGGAPEIYAWGMRNPWRWSFDRATGDLWVGDVGQNTWEEVDKVERGGNYGWNTREGMHCYKVDPCETVGLIDPLAEYSHSGDSASIVGGYVYRGAEIPALVGTYLYTDTYTGMLWGLHGDDKTGGWVVDTLLDTTGLIAVSFAERADGELFLVDYAAGTLHKLVTAAPDTGNPDFPTLLSETGCVNAENPEKAAASMFPYEVNMALWSDGADKKRWLALPDDEAVTAGETGDLSLPIGSVAMKSFYLEDRLVETRLLVHHADDSWGGYSYAWREDGSDAELLPSSKSEVIGNQVWNWPSRSQCLQCHTDVSARALGLELAELDKEVCYENGAVVNQLAQMEHLGMLSSADSTVPALPTLSSDASQEEKARAYLHANCAMCHQPGSVGGGSIDLRWTTPFAETGLCNGQPERGDIGVEGALLLAPGDPDHSLISLRMRATDVNRMPPLASDVVDEAGLAVIDAWISGLTACP